MQTFLGIFAAIGVIAVIFVAVSFFRVSPPALDHSWNDQYGKMEVAFKYVEPHRVKPHDATWHSDYEREFFTAISGITTVELAKSFTRAGVLQAPALFKALADLSQEEVEIFWAHAHKTGSSSAPGSGTAVAWDLVWVILSGELLRRLAVAPRHQELAQKLMLKSASILAPRTLKVDNVLV